MRITCNVTKSSSNVLLKSHVHTNTHLHRRRIQIPSPTDKGDFIHRCKRQRQRQVTDTNFPKSREFVLAANTMCQQQQYQHHHIKTITFPLCPILWRAFLSWTKFGCLLVQAFLFFSRGGKEMKWFLFWKMRVKFLVYIYINWTQTG